MGEKQFVSKGQSVSFEGVFSLKGLYRTIDEYFHRLGYDKYEGKALEAVNKGGKYSVVELEYNRKLNDYVDSRHKVVIEAENMVPVDIKKGDTRQRMQKGRVSVTMDSIMETDYELRWEGKPFYYLMRLIWERYVWAPMSLNFKSEIKNVISHFFAEVKAYLNLGKF